MKTIQSLRREIIGIHTHSPEGEDQIIDDIIKDYIKEITIDVWLIAMQRQFTYSQYWRILIEKIT